MLNPKTLLTPSILTPSIFKILENTLSAGVQAENYLRGLNILEPQGSGLQDSLWSKRRRHWLTKLKADVPSLPTGGSACDGVVSFSCEVCMGAAPAEYGFFYTSELEKAYQMTTKLVFWHVCNTKFVPSSQTHTDSFWHFSPMQPIRRCSSVTLVDEVDFCWRRSTHAAMLRRRRRPRH